MFVPYRPEPYSDFTEAESAAAYRAAVESVRDQLGAHYPLVIGGENVDTENAIVSTNPANPDEVVGTTASATAELADRALDAAWAAFPGWAATPAEERAGLLVDLAAILRRRKFELSAWQSFEAGKNFGEAEADVAEAIDFVEYYARSAVDMAEPVATYDMAGERNDSSLHPIGVGLSVSPWNFPLAICAGMATGPVAAGNTVIMKPAGETPVIAAKFMEAVIEAGIPPGVYNYLPGSGAVVGEHLVDHPRVRFINFTGSKEVGLRIAKRSQEVHTGQKWMKRAYMEMGGKDGIVVDETADLDAAAAAAVRSAFGFQGQKCSAASRLIVVDDVYDEIVDRVVDLVGTLEVGAPIDNGVVGPVISARQRDGILAEIEKGKTQAKLVAGGSAIDRDGGHYIEPTVFVDVPSDSRLAQYEIFGPVLSIIRADDFDHAVEIFNGTEYGLTGGLFSGDPDRLERARREFYVGNLYLNRKITGAFVGVQPFGGFNMSGSNSKAGGPDYLRLFMEMKTVAEKI